MPTYALRTVFIFWLSTTVAKKKKKRKKEPRTGEHITQTVFSRLGRVRIKTKRLKEQQTHRNLSPNICSRPVNPKSGSFAKQFWRLPAIHRKLRVGLRHLLFFLRIPRDDSTCFNAIDMRQRSAVLLLFESIRIGTVKKKTAANWAPVIIARYAPRLTTKTMPDGVCIEVPATWVQRGCNVRTLRTMNWARRTKDAHRSQHDPINNRVCLSLRK